MQSRGRNIRHLYTGSVAVPSLHAPRRWAALYFIQDTGREKYQLVAFDMAVEAWYMDSSDEDQRKPHRLNPNQNVSLEQLRALGVFYWKVKSRYSVLYLQSFTQPSPQSRK